MTCWGSMSFELWKIAQEGVLGKVAADARQLLGGPSAPIGDAPSPGIKPGMQMKLVAPLPPKTQAVAPAPVPRVAAPTPKPIPLTRIRA